MNRIRSLNTNRNGRWFLSRRWRSDFPQIRENRKPLIIRPGFPVAASVIVKGSTLPDDSTVDMKEFFQGAKMALQKVTQVLKTGELDSYPNMFHPTLLERLKKAISGMADFDREMLEIKKDDVFFSWIGNVVNEGEATQIKFVALSFPRYEEMRQNANNKYNLEEELRKEIANLASRGEDPEIIRGKMDNLEIKELNRTRSRAYDSGRILISNITFERSDSSSSWIVNELAIVDSASAHTPLGAGLWKLRLKASVESRTPFMNFLRLDYFTNWILALLTVTYLMANSG